MAQVRDGDDAVRAILEHRPAVAVVDHRMPGLSGVSVARPVKRADAGPAQAISSTAARAAAVHRSQPGRPQDHFRDAFRTLNFMPNT